MVIDSSHLKTRFSGRMHKRERENAESHFLDEKGGKKKRDPPLIRKRKKLFSPSPTKCQKGKKGGRGRAGRAINFFIRERRGRKKDLPPTQARLVIIRPRNPYHGEKKGKKEKILYHTAVREKERKRSTGTSSNFSIRGGGKGKRISLHSVRGEGTRFSQGLSNKGRENESVPIPLHSKRERDTGIPIHQPIRRESCFKLQGEKASGWISIVTAGKKRASITFQKERGTE